MISQNCDRNEAAYILSYFLDVWVHPTGKGCCMKKEKENQSMSQIVEMDYQDTKTSASRMSVDVRLIPISECAMRLGISVRKFRSWLDQLNHQFGDPAPVAGKYLTEAKLDQFIFLCSERERLKRSARKAKKQAKQVVK